MPEGDTIHRIARRLDEAFRGQTVEHAATPSARSPLHHRAGELEGRAFTGAVARGKHLLARFDGEVVLHSHLGMNGRFRVAADGALPRGRPWLVFASGPAVATQAGGQILRLVTESRARNDPGLVQLGPDPLDPGFDPEREAPRLRRLGAGMEVGEALLDQRVIAGIGNAIRTEALFRAGMSPWHPVADLSSKDSVRILEESRRVMRISLDRGRRPRSIYRGTRERCPRCGGRIRSRGQGDANRIAYWCEGCQT